jgi:hypothetical protein
MNNGGAYFEYYIVLQTDALKFENWSLEFVWSLGICNLVLIFYLDFGIWSLPTI